jgi:hypothetical protein
MAADTELDRRYILGSVQQEVASLIQGRQTADSRLYEAINLLNKQLELISRSLDPLARQALDITLGISSLSAPGDFTAYSVKTSVRFTWSAVEGAGSYEVREGTAWDTAFLKFRTVGVQGDIDPLVYGTYYFLIKTIDPNGNYSLDSEACTFIVPQIAAPVITVSVIDNNVLLYWSEPVSTFKIDYYTVKKAGAPTGGRVDGTFTSIFEVVAGTYQYEVTAVDIATNVGETATVSAEVATPPDYALQDTRISGLNGTRWQVLRLPIRPSLLCCWQAQTWHEHFQVLRSWINIQAQISAGYPIYIQPTAINGWYEEVLDYGAVINNTIVTITWNTVFWTPNAAVNVDVKMSVSDDGINYSPVNAGASQYFRSLRYLKFRLEFTAENDTAFIELYNLTISLNVKRENDGGSINAVSTDPGGTTVLFNKAFKDIESITCTTQSPTEPFVVIFDFVDIPNPTFFKVFVFDTMGARVSKLIDWKARGIV